MPGIGTVCTNCKQSTKDCNCLEHESLEGMAVAAASVILFCGLVLFAIVSAVSY